MNIIGQEGYYATVTDAHGISWGFTVDKSCGDIFTVKLGKDILNCANKIYKEKCPDNVWEEVYDPNVIFVRVRYDMTEYKPSVSYEGDEVMIPASEEKIGTYNQEKNLLHIWEGGLPVYENDNGVICKDTYALADCLM